MRRYIKHIILFLLPLVVYGITVRFIDPYNNFGNSKLSKQQQMSYAYPHNRTLYRMLQFFNSDKTKVLIGDSRMNYIGALTDTIDTEFFNFSTGGATMYQMIDVFDFVTTIRDVDEIVFQVSFDDFNEQQDHSEVYNSMKIANNNLLYVYGLSNLKVMWSLIKDGVTGEQTQIGKVEGDKWEYWAKELAKEEEFHSAKNYVYANKLKKKLEGMVAICDKEKIKINMVLLPVHNDVLEIVKRENGENYQKFKRYITQLVGENRFIDMSEFQVINDSSSFSDPYHLQNDEVRLSIFKQLTSLSQ